MSPCQHNASGKNQAQNNGRLIIPDWPSTNHTSTLLKRGRQVEQLNLPTCTDAQTFFAPQTTTAKLRVAPNHKKKRRLLQSFRKRKTPQTNESSWSCTWCCICAWDVRPHRFFVQLNPPFRDHFFFFGAFRCQSCHKFQQKREAEMQKNTKIQQC